MKEAPDRLKNTEEEPENLKCDEKMEILQPMFCSHTADGTQQK